MSVGRERKVETRFARKAATGKGIGIEEAVANAEARIETMREETCARIGAMLQEMQAVFGAGGPEAMRAVHGQADTLVGLCDLFGLPEIGQAALSLCRLFDACAPGSPKPGAVSVHLSALQLFWSTPPAGRADVAPSVLEGLRKVVAAAPRASAPGSGLGS